MARSIQLKRKLEFGAPGKLPTTWEDYKVLENYVKTADGEPFLIMDEELEGSVGKVWGWCSNTGLSVLGFSKHLYGYGTFEICKYTLFHQLWVIVGRSDPNKVSLPCAFFLLPDKRKSTYVKILEKLLELGVKNTEVFHCDFEKGAIRAVQAVLPKCIVVCCDTHWKRALRTNQSEIGLLVYINKDVGVQTFNRLLWALSYVPQEDVLKVYEEEVLPRMVVGEDDEEDDSPADYNKKMDAYLEYFETTWLGKKNRRTGI